VNTCASLIPVETAETRVLEIQRKLHHWAIGDSDRCFTDLFNLVCDPNREGPGSAVSA